MMELGPEGSRDALQQTREVEVHLALSQPSHCNVLRIDGFLIERVRPFLTNQNLAVPLPHFAARVSLPTSCATNCRSVSMLPTLSGSPHPVPME